MKRKKKHPLPHATLGMLKSLSKGFAKQAEGMRRESKNEDYTANVRLIISGHAAGLQQATDLIEAIVNYGLWEDEE